MSNSSFLRASRFGGCVGLSAPAALFCLAFPLAAQSNAARLTGTVFDSTRNIALAAAEVFLVGTDYSAVTNEDGRFFIPEIPPGNYAVSFRHPRLQLLGIAAETVLVRLDSAGVMDVELRIPAEVRLAAPPVSSPSRQPVASQPTVLIGTVIDAESQRPLAGASLRISGTAVSNVTDARGRFVLFGVRPGTRELEVLMLGYATRTEQIAVTAGTTHELTIRLATRPIELAPIEVSVRSGWLDRVGYYERRDDPGSSAHFIERTDIEKRNLIAFQEVFQNVPAVQFEYIEPGRRGIRFRRVVSSSGDFCVPPVYLDGTLVRGSLDFISVAWVEAVEVHVGSTAPVPYGNSCGTVLIWTRHGG